MNTGDTTFVIPQQRSTPRETSNVSPVGDLFAPFFDVVFYSPTTDVGEILDIKASQLESNPVTRAAAAALRAQAAAAQAAQALTQAAALGNTQSIGASRLSLRSVGGGLQSYSPEGPDSALGQLVNYRSSLEVTMLSAAALQATLTLMPPYEAAIEIVDNKLIKYGSLMEIQWGYLALDGSGKPAISDKGLFRITQPSIKFGQQTTITIGGFDILSSALQTQDTRCQWLREQYPCDLDIVRQIISRRAGSGVSLDYSKLSANSPLRRKKSDEGVVQADDDWTFFRRILRQNDCTFLQHGSTIAIMDESTVADDKPLYRMVWFKQPQSEYEIPMEAFETNPIMSLFAGSPGVRGQRTICRDPETKQLTVIDSDPGNTGVAQTGAANTQTSNRGFKTDVVRTSGGSVAAFAPLDAACASGRFFTEPCRRPNQQEETDRENRETRMYHNTRASAVCPGVPGLIPQQVVDVQGVGVTFSGTYRVMKVTHSIGSGYSMKVDLLRSSSSGSIGQGDAASPDKPNTQHVDPEASSGQLVTPVLVTDAGAPHAGCVDAQATAARDAAVQAAAAAARRAGNAQSFFL